MCNLKMGGAARLRATESKLVGGMNYADRTTIDVCAAYSGKVIYIVAKY